MINGIISVLIIFVILGVGFFMTKKSLWPENTNKVFSTTVVKIAAPALAVVSIENRFTGEDLIKSVPNLAILVASLVIMFFLGKLLSRLLKLSPGKRVVFNTSFMFNNTMFIGLPIISIVFGDPGLPYLFTFYLVTIVLFWSVAPYVYSAASGDGKGHFSIKKIISPGLIGVIIGCILAATGLRLPQILETSLTYLGNICVPLSLLVIGSNLARSLSKGPFKIEPSMLLVAAGKFIIHPLLVWALFNIFSLAGPGLPVFIMVSAMPCHAQNAIMADYYNLEGEYASNLVSLSTLISLISIPVYATFLLG